MAPERVTTDKATCYPPALRAAVPDAEHRTSKYLNDGLERDHGQGALWAKQRRYPMRRFKQATSADILARGHAFNQNLRNGFSKLTATVPRQLRVMTAWSQLIPAI